MDKFTDYIFDIVQNSIKSQATSLDIIIKIKNKLCLIIKDNGQGMTKKTKKLIISPFYTTQRTRHIGLGLPLIILLTKQTRGHYTITSRVNHGTTVKFIFDHTHLDFPSVGDYGLLIADIACHQQLEHFSFIYQFQNKHFIWHYQQQDRDHIVHMINKNIERIEDTYENIG